MRTARGFVCRLVISIPVLICTIWIAGAPSVAMAGFSTLHSFGASGDGYCGGVPFDSNRVGNGDLTLVNGDTLYGMTNAGGAHDTGTIFKVNTNGTSYQILYSFGATATDGVNPYGSLTLVGSELYGMTYGGAPTATARFSSLARTATATRCCMISKTTAPTGSTPRVPSFPWDRCSTA